MMTLGDVGVAASQAEMEAGTETGVRRMTPARVAQAIAALGGATPDILTLGVQSGDPAPPAADHIKVYVKATGLYIMDSSGNISALLF